MKGKILNFSKRDCITKEGKRFSILDINVNVALSDGVVRRYKSSMSFDYAKKYFSEVVKSKTSDCIGRDCTVFLETKIFVAKDGTEKTYTYIKYLYVNDENGNPIKPEKKSDIDF